MTARASGPGPTATWSSLRSRLPEALVACGAVAMSARAAATVFQVATGSERLQSWDMAAHGYAGIELVEAVRHAAPLTFLSQLNSFSLWPPLFPLLECPVFLLFGYDYAVARGFVSVLLFCCAALIYWTGRQLDESYGHLIGTIAASLLCTSPIVLEYGALVMLEIPGTMLLLLGLGFYLRFLRTGKDRDLTVCALFTTALWFCKYNYGVMWMLPLAACELRRRGVRFSSLATKLRAVAAPHRWLSPFPLFVVLYIAFVASIASTGGWVWQFGGHRISVRGIGNPLYLLMLILMTRALTHVVARRLEWREWVARLAPGDRGLLVAALPIPLWLLVPTHFKDLFGFMSNRSSGFAPASAESLLFYPRAFASEYSTTQACGIAVLVLALLSIPLAHRFRPAVEAVLLTLVIGFLAATLHPYKEPRFLFTVAPLVWLASGVTVATLCSRLISARAARPLTGALAAMALLVAAIVKPVASSDIELRIERDTPPASTALILDAVARVAGEADGSVILGTWNWLSPDLIGWECRRRSSAVESGRIPQDVRRLCGDRSTLAILDALAHAERVEKILVIGTVDPAQPWQQSFARENAWLDPVRAALAHDVRFQLASTETFPSAGYELRVFHRKAKPVTVDAASWPL